MPRHLALLGALALACKGGPAVDTQDTSEPAETDDTSVTDTDPVETADTGPVDTAPPARPFPAQLVTDGVPSQSIAAGPYPGDVRVETPYPIPHAVLVRFEHDGARALTSLVCEAPSGPEEPPERHRLSLSGAGEVLEVPLTGLLVDTTYTCEALLLGPSGPERATFAVATDSLDAELRAFGLSVATPTAEGAPFGFTVFNVRDHNDTHQYAVAVDPQGRFRWSFRYEVQEGTVAVSYDPAKRLFLVGGGRLDDNIPPTAIAETGEVVGAAPVDNAHHEAFFAGDAIYTLTGADVGICTASYSWPELAERSRWCTADTPVLAQYGDTSANSVAIVDQPDGRAQIVSLSGTGAVVKVDEATGAVRWQFGEGLDFTGMDGAWSEWVHDVRVVPCDESELCLLYYDNGVEHEQSRAVLVALDEAAMTASIVREWTEEGWYEPRWGGIDPLDDGSWLIAIGHLESWETSTPNSAIVQVSPAGDVTWRLNLLPTSYAMYRARRVGPCDAFDHQGLCEQADPDDGG